MAILDQPRVMILTNWVVFEYFNGRHIGHTTTTPFEHSFVPPTLETPYEIWLQNATWHQ